MQPRAARPHAKLAGVQSMKTKTHRRSSTILATSHGDLAAHLLELLHQGLQQQRQQAQCSSRPSSNAAAAAAAEAATAGSSPGQLTEEQLRDVLPVAAQHGSPEGLRFFLALAREASPGQPLPADLAAEVLRRAWRSGRESMLVALLATGACALAPAEAFTDALLAAARSAQPAAAARHGAGVTPGTIVAAMHAPAVRGASRWSRALLPQLRLLRLLLQHSAPAVPLGSKQHPASVDACPQFQVMSIAWRWQYKASRRLYSAKQRASSLSHALSAAGP